MIDKKRVGKTIAFYRKSTGMTQRELAEALHISYQAVSKWEAGVSLPAVEMLCEIADILSVSMDVIIRGEDWADKVDIYRQAGLNTTKLYSLKEQLQDMVSKDEDLINSYFAEPVIYKTDTSGMKEPVHAVITAVPGSKIKLAREQGFDREICADVAANGMNFILSYGMKPVVLKGMVLCGNSNNEQLRNMAQTLKRVCEENQVMFAGMEVASQPMNYTPEEYEVQVTVAGAGDRERIVTGEKIQEGDVILGLETEGINAVNYPLIKMMMEKKPGLLHAKINGEHYFCDELLKPNVSFCQEIALLLKEDIPHGIFKNNNAVGENVIRRIPAGLGIRIDLDKLPVLPLYRFLAEQELVSVDVMPYCFQMGIGMMVAVPEKRMEEAMKIIRRYHPCHYIGGVEKYSKQKYPDGRIWAEGRMKL